MIGRFLKASQMDSNFCTSKEPLKILPESRIYCTMLAVTLCCSGRKLAWRQPPRLSQDCCCPPTHTPIPAVHVTAPAMSSLDPGRCRGTGLERQAASQSLLGRNPPPNLMPLFPIYESYLLDQETFLVAIVFPAISYPNFRNLLLERMLKSIYVRHQS